MTILNTGCKILQHQLPEAAAGGFVFPTLFFLPSFLFETTAYSALPQPKADRVPTAGQCKAEAVFAEHCYNPSVALYTVNRAWKHSPHQ
jgi:hypothetical protein